MQRNTKITAVVIFTPYAQIKLKQFHSMNKLQKKKFGKFKRRPGGSAGAWIDTAI